MKNKSLYIILIAVAILLLIPLIAMQFTNEINWTIFDFVVMGILLLITGLLCEFVLRKVTKTKHKIALCLVILLAFIIVWAELSVGVFGTVFSGS